MPPGMAGCLMHQGAPLPVLDLLGVLEPGTKARAPRARPRRSWSWRRRAAPASG